MLVNIWPGAYSAPAAGGQDEHQGDAGHGLWQLIQLSFQHVAQLWSMSWVQVLVIPTF